MINENIINIKNEFTKYFFDSSAKCKKNMSLRKPDLRTDTFEHARLCQEIGITTVTFNAVVALSGEPT